MPLTLQWEKSTSGSTRYVIVTLYMLVWAQQRWIQRRWQHISLLQTVHSQCKWRSRWLVLCVFFWLWLPLHVMPFKACSFALKIVWRIALCCHLCIHFVALKLRYTISSGFPLFILWTWFQCTFFPLVHASWRAATCCSMHECFETPQLVEQPISKST